MYKFLFKIILVSTVLFSCKNESSIKTIRLAHGLDRSHPVHKAMVFMAKRIKEKSKGKLLLKIYSNQQLGSERQCLELLQIGSLGMTKVSAATLEGFVPQYKALGMPYIFRDTKHRYKFFDSEVGKEILHSGSDKWLRGLTYYDAGSRSMYTKDKAILVPEDLKGLKIRVMKSNTAVQMVNALGGSPTPISWGELYTALQSGVVDGAENNITSFYLSRHYEVCKYLSIDEHTSIPDVLLISTIIWKSLSTQQQKWIEEAAQESAIYQRKLWEESESSALEKLKEHNIIINYVDKTPFKNKVKSVYKLYENDSKIFPLIQKIKSL